MLCTPPLQAIVNYSESLLMPQPDWLHCEHAAQPSRATTVAAGENMHKYGTFITHGEHFIISTAMLYTQPLQTIVNYSESLLTASPVVR